MAGALSEVAPSTGRRRWLARLRARLRARLERLTFEVRVWNTVDPKDPHVLLLWLGDPTPLRETLLVRVGSGALDHPERIELYSRLGLRITGWMPPRLFWLGIRQATLYPRRSTGEQIRLARNAVIASLLVASFAITSIRLAAGPSRLDPHRAECAAPAVRAAANLVSSCGGLRPCEAHELVARGELTPELGSWLSGRVSVLVPGFETGSSTVPAAFAPALAAFLRVAERDPSCRRVLVIGRASPGGRREANLTLAAARARTVRDRITTGSPGSDLAREHGIVLVWGSDLLPVDLARLRVELTRASIAVTDDPAAFARLAQQSVELVCVGCPEDPASAVATASRR